MPLTAIAFCSLVAVARIGVVIVRHREHRRMVEIVRQIKRENPSADVVRMLEAVRPSPDIRIRGRLPEIHARRTRPRVAANLPTPRSSRERMARSI